MERRMGIGLVVALVVVGVVAVTGNARGQTGSGMLSGVIVDRDTGEPLEAEIGIVIRGQDGALTLKHITASGGLFAVERLPIGITHVTTKLAAYAPEHATISITDRAAHVLELRLAKARVLHGVVYDPAGKPVPGAVVSVVYATDPAHSDLIQATYQWETGDVVTDEKGTFVLHIHPDREFIVQAEYGDFLPAISDAMRADARGAPVAATLVLEQGMSVTGTVQDSSGRPLRDARIRVFSLNQESRRSRFPFSEAPRGRPAWVSSGVDGQFRIERARPGLQRIEVLREGYQSSRTDLVVPYGSGELQLPVVVLERR